MKRYYKVWFSNGHERTAKLVLDTERFPCSKMSVEKYSRLFPSWEAPKMKALLTTSEFDTYLEAFHERSKAMDMLIPSGQQFYAYDSNGQITGVRK